jgi:hypothetical protein
MHAFGLAVTQLGLEVTQTDLVDMNLEQLACARRTIIHYCYGDATWDKRFFVEVTESQNVWFPQVSAGEGTILGEILAQIIEARKFYNNLFP